MRILITGMCNFQDRLILNSTCSGASSLAFPLQVKTYSNVLNEFNRCRNTGNYLISEAVCKLLEKHEPKYIPFWFFHDRLERGDFFKSELRELYDVCIFVTANILNVDFDLSSEVRFLQEIDIPVVFMSIGVQNVSDLKSFSNPTFRAFINELKKDNRICFTRGASALKFLNSHDVQVVYDACCPSSFLYSNNILKSLHSLKNGTLGNDTEIVFGGYIGGGIEKDLDINAMRSVSDSINYVLQDEPILFNIFSSCGSDQEIYEETTGKFLVKPISNDYDFSDSNVSFEAFFDPVQWRLRASHADYAVGHRFHGNLVAMQSGVPSVFVAHDERVLEMLSSLAFPFIPKNEWIQATNKRALIEEFIEKFDLELSINNYMLKFEKFHNQLNVIFG